MLVRVVAFGDKDEEYSRIFLAIDGILSAVLHNGSTIMTGLKSATRLIETKGN